MSVFKPIQKHYFRHIFSSVLESLSSGLVVSFDSEDECDPSSLRS